MRSEPRVRLNTAVEATFVAEGVRGAGRVYDLSERGLFLRTPTLVKAGSRIQVELTTPKRTEFIVHGVVCWNTATLPSRQEDSGFGVQVTRAGGDYRRFVSAVISSLGSRPLGRPAG